jgi:hypothetical protein
MVFVSTLSVRRVIVLSIVRVLFCMWSRGERPVEESREEGRKADVYSTLPLIRILSDLRREYVANEQGLQDSW